MPETRRMLIHAVFIYSASNASDGFFPAGISEEFTQQSLLLEWFHNYNQDAAEKLHL
jgi:hypothetical protein